MSLDLKDGIETQNVTYASMVGSLIIDMVHSWP
jgi:hypothetical protein